MEKLTEGYNSIIGVDYVSVDDVLSTAEWGDGGITVTLKDAKQWTPLYFTPGSASFEDKPVRDGAGLAYEQQFTSVYPGDTLDLYADLEAMSRGRFLARLRYSRGSLIVGSVKRGVLFEAKRSDRGGLGVEIGFKIMARSRAKWERE